MNGIKPHTLCFLNTHNLLNVPAYYVICFTFYAWYSRQLCRFVWKETYFNLIPGLYSKWCFNITYFGHKHTFTRLSLLLLIHHAIKNLVLNEIFRDIFIVSAREPIRQHLVKVVSIPVCKNQRTLSTAFVDRGRHQNRSNQLSFCQEAKNATISYCKIGLWFESDDVTLKVGILLFTLNIFYLRKILNLFLKCHLCVHISNKSSLNLTALCTQCGWWCYNNKCIKIYYISSCPTNFEY